MLQSTGIITQTEPQCPCDSSYHPYLYVSKGTGILKRKRKYTCFLEVQETELAFSKADGWHVSGALGYALSPFVSFTGLPRTLEKQATSIISLPEDGT